MERFKSDIIWQKCFFFLTAVQTDNVQTKARKGDVAYDTFSGSDDFVLVNFFCDVRLDIHFNN